jgi:hypothetical protein
VGVYAPRSPTTGVLSGVVRTHLTELLAAVDATTDGLPGFVVARVRRRLARLGVAGGPNGAEDDDPMTRR